MILPEPAVLRGNLDKIIKEQVRKDLDMLTEEVWKVAQYINDVASKYCRDISPLHPAAHVVNQVFDMKDQYLSRMLPNGFYKTTVKDLAEIAQFVPRVSIKIIQTRTSHLILASQSRLIKHLLRFCEKDTKYFETKKFVLKNLF